MLQAGHIASRVLVFVGRSLAHLGKFLEVASPDRRRHGQHGGGRSHQSQGREVFGVVVAKVLRQHMVDHMRVGCKQQRLAIGRRAKDCISPNRAAADAVFDVNGLLPYRYKALGAKTDPSSPEEFRELAGRKTIE